MHVEAMNITSHAEAHIELCARVTTKTVEQTGSKPDFLHSVLKRGHWSILEQADASFYIKGISRACSHQLVRHRLFSFLQESQRYARVRNLAQDVTVPESIFMNPEADAVYDVFMQKAEEAYQKLLDLKVPKEDARMVLPNATTTNLIMKGNFRLWLMFLRERLNKPAQWEIKDIAHQIYIKLNEASPGIFNREILEMPTRYDFSILDSEM